jgi:hypothetical protein
MTTGVSARAARRMRFRSRSAAVIVALLAVTLGAVYLGTEAALVLLSQPPLVSAPFGLLDAADADPLVSGGAAAVLALIGVVCLVCAVTPGRFRRRFIADERATIVVDDDVLASSISRSVAIEAKVARSQVRTSLGRRRAEVRVTPTTGFDVSDEPVRQVGEQLLARGGVTPPVKTRAVIERSGVIA